MARAHGAKNYRRPLLMELVSEFLPNGHSLWKAVAAEYQRRSGESEERDPHEMEKYWRFKMCNNYKKPTGGGGPKYEMLLQCLGIARKIMGKSSATVLGGASGDEESCVMMGRSKEDSSDEEDGNSSEDDGSDNGEFYDNGNDDAEMDGDGDEDKEGDGEVDGEGTETRPSLGTETRPSLGTETRPSLGTEARPSLETETRPSLLAGDFAGNQSSAFSAVRSPRPESAPPQLGADGFRRLTFGNDPLTRTLQRMPVNLFGRDEDVFGDDVEGISGITPPPDSRREKQTRRSISSSNKTKNSTNKKRQSVSQSIDMLCQKIGKAPTAQSGDGGGYDVYATTATFLGNADDASGA